MAEDSLLDDSFDKTANKTSIEYFTEASFHIDSRLLIGYFTDDAREHQFENQFKVMETNADNFKALNLISHFLVKSEKYPIGLSAINMSIKVNNSLATNHAAYRLRSRIQRHLAVIERYRIRGKSDWGEYHRLSGSALDDLESVKLSGLSEWNEFSELELCGLIFMAQVMVFIFF